ncbi:hypothetical protein [Pseudomonas sp. 91RF]|uniref:hypothetical protein n=1 Tax=Pseudomonas sp. 91RF TaxID=2292261 RepID=UPI0011C3DE98|nr:hypothetical protein [Pseudomonas sp. 91RF]
MITDYGREVANGAFNESGASINPLENLAPGPHSFELRPDRNSPPIHTWPLTVEPVAPVRNENFNNVPIGNYPGALITPGLKITATSGAFGVTVYTTPNHQVPSLPGKIDGRAAVLQTNSGAMGIFRCDFPQPTNAVTFYYARVLFLGGSVAIYDRAQNMIQTLPLQVTGPYDSPIAHLMAFNAVDIARCDIITPPNNGIVVDNFTF